MAHLTLSELNQIIKTTLESTLDPSYWIVAEIGEIRITQKGHCYLELIEKVDDQILSKLRANIWSYTYRNLGTWFEATTGQGLQKGMKILANAVVQYHEVFGLSLVIRDIDPNFTLGEREKKRRETIDQLKKEGVFEMNRELTLPAVPQNIAVVSSSTAAGLEDFINQLNQNPRGYRFNIRLFKAVMQGSEAKESVIQALHQAFARFQDFDILAIIRGGGSQVDLDCFDSYELASHVAQFPLPVITGIGHERDETIVDLVAHTKMKTPTAVSEFIIQGFREFEDNMDSMIQRLNSLAANRIQVENQVLESSIQKLTFLLRSKIESADRQLESVSSTLTAEAIRILSHNKVKLDSLGEKLKTYPLILINNQYQRLDHLEHSIQLMDPSEILKRGYSITLVNNKPANEVKKISKQDKLKTRTLRWEVESIVDSAAKRNNG